MNEKKIIEIKTKILQILDQFRVDNEGQKLTQWNFLALRSVIENELKKLDGLFTQKENKNE